VTLAAGEPPTEDPLEVLTQLRRRKALRFLFFTSLAALLAVVVVGWLVDGGATGDDTPLVTGVYDTPDGGQLDLTSFRGEPLVVNFFASWCAPCRAELPEFARVSRDLDGTVRFVALNTRESAADVPAALELLAETGVTFPVGLGENGSLLETVGATVMPTTVFVDRDGRAVVVHQGQLDAASLTEIIEDELLG
jgi:thiol-disulfide isomerase/thioredoxin